MKHGKGVMMTEDRNSLEYLIALREKFNNRYEDKPVKPRPAAIPQPQTQHDYPLGGWPWICGGFKNQGENL